VQDLNEWGFGGLLSRMVVHAVARMRKTIGRRNKRNVARETEGTPILDLVGLLV
jgi:hypothetical protein